MKKCKETALLCDSCRAKTGVVRMYGVSVNLCDNCDGDRFRRGEAIARARGEKWDPASVGGPTL